MTETKEFCGLHSGIDVTVDPVLFLPSADRNEWPTSLRLSAEVDGAGTDEAFSEGWGTGVAPVGGIGPLTHFSSAVSVKQCETKEETISEKKIQKVGSGTIQFECRRSKTVA
jgi:hypothetical protein